MLGASAACHADYPGIDSPKICNGYPTAEGVIDIVTPTTTYKSSSGVYIRLTTPDNKKYGGLIYQRSSTEYGYHHMINAALISLITRTPAKICYDQDVVYAVSIQNATS